jgi:hypothetical protein
VKSATPPTPINEYSPTVGNTLADARTQRQVGKQKLIKVVFEVPDEHGPTLRSAVEELRNRIGTRIENNIYLHPVELSLTRAASVVGIMAAAVNAKVEDEDPDYNAM